MKRPVPLINIVLLLFTAAVNMATLKNEGGDNHGETSEEVEWLSWNNQHRQRLTVTIQPIDDRLEPVGHDGPIYLQVSLIKVPERSDAVPRWAVSTMSNDGPWATDGDFPPLLEAEGDPGEHVITRQIGRLCERGERADDGCIPCYLSDGCVVNVEVDFCYTVGDHTVGAVVALTDADGEPFSLTCLENTDSEPCTRLRDWIDASGESSEPGLCVGE